MADYLTVPTINNIQHHLNFSFHFRHFVELRKFNLNSQGRLVDDYWVPGQKMMGDIKFLDTLRAYDKDNIPPAIMKRIRETYVTDVYFDPNLVKKVSTACEGLCKWVRRKDNYILMKNCQSSTVLC